MRCLEGFQDARQDVGAHRRRRGDEKLADLSRTQILHGLLPIQHLGDRALRVGEQRTPGVGQRHPAGRSHEELHAELAFEALEPCGKGRLRDAERVGGAANVPEAGHLAERLELR